MHVSLWEKDMRRIQAQEALSDATRTLSDEAGRQLRLLVCRMANEAAANAVGPQTRLNYAASLLKFESWLEHRERDQRRNRRRNVHLDGKRVHESEAGELRRTVAQCLDGQVPIVRQTRCPQIAENLERPPGLAMGLLVKTEVPFLCTSRRAPACETVRPRASTSRGLAEFLNHPSSRRNWQTNEGTNVQRCTRAGRSLGSKTGPLLDGPQRPRL